MTSHSEASEQRKLSRYYGMSDFSLTFIGRSAALLRPLLEGINYDQHVTEGGYDPVALGF